MCGTTYSSLQCSNTLNYRRMITDRAVYHALSAVNGLSRLTKLNQQRSRHGRFDSKIFESANPFRMESNRTAESNSNRISKLRRSLKTRITLTLIYK